MNFKKQVHSLINELGIHTAAKKAKVSALALVCYAAGYGKPQARTLEALEKFFGGGKGKAKPSKAKAKAKPKAKAKAKTKAAPKKASKPKAKAAPKKAAPKKASLNSKPESAVATPAPAAE
jgi:hypothetical protein